MGDGEVVRGLPLGGIGELGVLSSVAEEKPSCS